MLNCNAKKSLTILLICLFIALALAPICSVNAQTHTYYYNFQGPFFMNGEVVASGTNIVCNLLWDNYSVTNITLSYPGTFTVNLVSTVELTQVTWNASSALNYTSLIVLKPFDAFTITQWIIIYIPDPNLPFSQYTFPVTDFAGMTNPYLEMRINNATGQVSPAQQVSLSAAGIPTFIMTQYYTYTLSFICDEGTFSQQFTAENTYVNQLTVPALAFTNLNVTVPTANADRLNATLIGISYIDPSNLTSSGSIIITHQNGVSTINDYSSSTLGNITTILWNNAAPGVDYNVNISSTIDGQSYLWVLAVPSAAIANPWIGIWDWLGSSTPTMPYVSTGWPLGMTTNQIAELAGGIIIAFFLTIGSFRSSGATCIVAWVMSGFLIAFGWWGNGTLGGVSAIPEFALSGFIAIMIQISEAKDVARET
jgi:hypothetical protein